MLLALTFSYSLFAQISDTSDTDNQHRKEICGHGSLNLGFDNTGICFGNSAYHTGIRFNVVECGIKEVNGINFTFWKGKEKTLNNFTMNGVSLGVLPTVGKGCGLSLGVGGVVAKEELFGINFGGLAVVSAGSLKGVNFGGLAAIAAEGGMAGINYGTLAAVSGAEMKGINMAGLACVSGSSMAGINIGGLACVAGANMTGVNIGGLALVGRNGITGINVGGIAIVAEDNDITGLNITLGKMVTKQAIKGINFAGYKIEAESAAGLCISCAWIDTDDLEGLSIAPFIRTYNKNSGLSIGIVNYAEELQGIQIGLLNIAKNNALGTIVFPFINAHFDF